MEFSFAEIEISPVALSGGQNNQQCSRKSDNRYCRFNKTEFKIAN